MGLLDFAPPSGGGGLLGDLFNDPGARLGMSLLAAGSPRLRGLNQVMAQQDQAKAQALQQQYVQSQIAENQAQAKQRDAAMARQSQLQNFIAQKFSGAQGQQRFAAGQTALDAGAAAGDMGPTVSNGQRQGMAMAQQPQSGFPMSFNDVVQLKTLGGPDLMDAFKLSQEGIKQEAGQYYRNPVTGQLSYNAKLDNGMTMQGDTVVPARGYAQANAGIKGAEAGAIEAAKFPYAVGQDSARQNLSARLDPTKVYNPQTGREEFVPRSAVAQPQYSGAGYAGGSATAAAPEQLQIMQSELSRLPANHPDRPAIMREMQRLGGGQPVAQSGNYAAGPSAAEAAANEARKVQAVEQVKADITPTASKIASVDTARDALNVIDQALTHPGLSKATGLQGTVDPRNYIPGTDATNFRVLMDQVKGGVFLDAYKDLRGSGAITDIEGSKAEAAKARINRAQSPDEFVKGLNDYKAILQRGYERAQARSDGGASGSWDDKKPAANLLPSLPPANTSNRGKVAINKETGERMRSNGMQWVKE